MLKNSFRKTLSVMIALVMIWTTFCIGQPLTASANVTTASASNSTSVYFVVPEAIYLKPTWNSYYTSVQMPFQWYVNNSLSSSGSVSTKTGEESSGDIYFRYANASTAKISFEWLSANGQATTGGTITVANSALSAGSTVTVNSSNNAVKITAGTSPSLTATQTGAYVRWTATFTDTADYRTKTVQAYTYIYKPYVQPVGTAIRTVNDRGDNHYGQNLSWISGVHDTDSSALGDYYPNSGTSKGLLTISSSANSGTLVDRLYAQIPDRWTTTSNNEGAGGWLNQTSSPQYVPDKSFRYYANNLTGHSSGDDAFHTLCYSPTAFMTIDVSRYTNLNQIPNLTLGLQVTDDESSDSGAALFVSNYTGTPTTEDKRDYFKNNTGPAETLWNQYNAANGDIFGAGTPSDRSASETEGVKYSGPWPKAISTSAGTSTYYVGTGYFNHQGSGSHYGGDTIWNISELRMKVTRYNKGTLRTAVQKAINNTSTLQGMFYDQSSTAWENYVNLYRAAAMALTKLDGTFSITASVNNSSVTYTDPGTLATALTNAVDTLLSGSARISNRKATQTNIVLQDRGDGSFVYAQFLNGSATRTTTFTTYNTVTFTADSVAGYTYIGLVRTTSAPTTVIGASAPYPESFTTSDTGASFNGSTVKYVHTDTTGCDGSGNLYYSYYYVANKYTVHFDANGGSGTMTDQSFTYNVAQNLNTNTFTRQGYSFAGWATSASGNVVYANNASVNNLTTAANGSYTLYAKWSTDTYTIQYDAAGGSIQGSYITEYNISTSVNLPNATKNGYSLTGWRADDSGNWGPMTYSVNTPATGKYGNVKFTAVWKANNYSVAFNANGGTGAAMSNQSFVYGTGQTLTANAFSREGYTFRGWALTNNATDPVYMDKERVQDLTIENNAVVTLYAVWGANSYTIVYSVDSGTIRDTSYTRTFTVNDQIGLPVTVEKTGYNFAGWKPASTSGSWNADTVYTGTVNAGMIGNVTLQAQWTKQGYNIQYVLNDGAITGTRYTTAYDITTAITLPSASKTGYTFDGWLANGAGNWGDSVYNAGNVSAGRYGDVTLTAQWTGVQYYVQFHGNGSTGGVMYNQSFTYGESAALSLNEYIRGGYTFRGWATSSTATTATYLDGATVMNLSVRAGATVTLYAVWEKNSYSITYVTAGGAITEPGMSSYSITDTVTLPTVTRTGYTSEGWRPQQNSGSWHTWDTYTVSVAPGCYGDVTLVAQWKKDSYTITYDAGGGTMSGNYTTVYDVDTVIVLPSVTRAGYTFGGWAASAAWNNVIVTDTAPAGVLGNVTLTALWTQKTYYVRFNANGGNGSMNDELMRFDVAQALTPNAFTRDGYNFGGWAMSETGTTAYADGDTVINLSQTDGGVVILYAVWSARNFSIVYNLNGAEGSLIATNVVMDGATVNLRAYNVTETLINDMPYAFAGWALSKTAADAGQIAYENKGAFTLNETLLAQLDVDWTPAKPTITLYAVWSDVEIKLVAGEDSTTVIDNDRHFIYGLKAEITRSELENEFLGVVGNGRVEITAGAIGTGTVVKLVSNFTNEVLAEYEIVIFGDLNGDGLINSTDVTKVRMINAGLIESSFNDVYTFAADLYADGEINSTDVTTMRMMSAGLRTYDQSTRQAV